MMLDLFDPFYDFPMSKSDLYSASGFNSYTKKENGEISHFFEFPLAGYSKENVKVSLKDQIITILVSPMQKAEGAEYSNFCIGNESKTIKFILPKKNLTFEGGHFKFGCLILKFKENKEENLDKYLKIS